MAADDEGGWQWLEVGGDVRDRFGGFGEEGAHRCRGFHGDTNRVAGSDGGGAEEQPRAPARGSRELPVSVRSSGWCWEVRRGTRAVVCGSSMMASMTALWRQQAEEEERVAPGVRGVLLL
jgi:hypothetical protein